MTDGEGCHVVYDSVGKDTFDGSLDCLRPRGTLVLFGGASGPRAAVRPSDPEPERRPLRYPARPRPVHRHPRGVALAGREPLLLDRAGQPERPYRRRLRALQRRPGPRRPRRAARPPASSSSYRKGLPMKLDVGLGSRRQVPPAHVRHRPLRRGVRLCRPVDQRDQTRLVSAARHSRRSVGGSGTRDLRRHQPSPGPRWRSPRRPGTCKTSPADGLSSASGPR